MGGDDRMEASGRGAKKAAIVPAGPLRRNRKPRPACASTGVLQKVWPLWPLRLMFWGACIEYDRKPRRSLHSEETMTDSIKPVRRVVTGNDAQGRSCVLYDSAAPNVNPGAIRPGTCMTDVWVYETCPVRLAGDRDDGRLPFSFEPPHEGGHLRIVQSPPKPA